MGFCQNIPTWFWASYFQNLNFFHFSWHIIRLVRRAVTIFLLTPTYKIAQNYIQSCPQCDFSWASKSIYWNIQIPHTLFIQGSHHGNMEKVRIESPETPKLRQVCGSIMSIYKVMKWYHKEFNFLILICG